jgi:hypothetical protein
LVALGLTATLTLLWSAAARFFPFIGSRTTLGLAITCGVLLTAAFIRRTFYMRRRPDLAAKLSLIFFS